MTTLSLVEDDVKLFGKKSRSDDQPVIEAPAPVEEEKPISVVVVDDDDDLRGILRIALESRGFDILGDTSDAMAALQVVRDGQPDIILLDLAMPEVTGLEVLPLLLEQSPRSKIVICSAISATHMTEAALDAGADAYIIKGVSAKTLIGHLRRVAHSGPVRPVRPYPLGRDYVEPPTPTAG
ncbi:response regulator [Nocardioides sp. LHG3406-4]|uniref:response regulator n=1 Tax=Nocardioides sp. LHG3406-4 TaxID=2804575 RepID=UPI003CF34F3E